MITAENITSHELIGLQARVVESANPQLVGLNGRVADETKSMLKIDTVNGMKAVPKNINVWEFSANGDKITVSGPKIAKRPFDRIGGKA